jgi:hypothetical protein
LVWSGWNRNLLPAGPFSQRVLLTLEEKKVPYEVKLVDLDNKPEWSVSLPLPLFPSPAHQSSLLYILSAAAFCSLHAVSQESRRIWRSAAAQAVFFFLFLITPFLLH